MITNFALTWLIFLTAVAVMLLLVWAAIRRRTSADTQRVLLVCLFAFLVTPTRLDPGSEYWAPAFMAALVEAFDAGIQAGLDRLWPTLIVMLVLVLLSVVWRLVQLWRRSAETG